MEDCKTHVSKYPNVGATCKSQVNSDSSMLQVTDVSWGADVNSLEHCPDFDERFTLADGKTRAVPYPEVYYNCKKEYQFAQQKDVNWGPSIDSLEHCPDFDERFTLADGKTRAVPYP